MPSIIVASLVFLAALASGSAGLALARARPRRAASGALAGFVGLLCLLLAAYLALALSSAYAAAAARNAAIRELAAEAIAFDLDLKLYGPEGAPLREALRADLALARALAVGDAAATASASNAAVSGLAGLRAGLARLPSAEETQRRLLASADAHFDRFSGFRLDLALQADEPAPTAPLLAALAGACVAFFGIGALGRPDAAALAALGLCAVALAGTYYMTMALNGPYPGWLGGAPAALEQAIAELGR